MSEQRFLGAIGRRYDDIWMARPHTTRLVEMVGSIVARPNQSSLAEAEPVVEIGCGPGISTQGLAAAIGPERRLIAVDHDLDMVERARARLAGSGVRIEWHHVDALEWLRGQPDRSVSSIGSVMTLHNWSGVYRTDALREISRVLVRGGWFANGDKYAERGVIHHEQLVNRVRKVFDELGSRNEFEVVRDWVVHIIEDESPERIMFEDEALAEMETLGLGTPSVLFREELEAVVATRKPGD